MNQTLKRPVLVFGLIVLLGCTGGMRNSQPIGEQSFLGEQPPPPKQLDLGGALARAILYNLDNRVRSMEHVIAKGNANLESFNLLPKMVATAGYFRRDREDLSNRVNVGAVLPFAAASKSADREQVVGSLGETWNALDFGIAMVRSEQLRAQEQAAIQRQRQSVQNILNETRYAYARASIAQRTKLELDAMLAEINSSLASQERAERSGLATPLVILQQQRDLLAVYNELLVLRQVLVSADRELNALVSLPPGTDVKLTPQRLADVPSPLNFNARELEILETVALLMHPELRGADSQVFVHQREIRRMFLSMMPSLQMSSTGSYESNDFALHSVYQTLGTKVTHNLLNFHKLPALHEQGSKRLELEEQKRLALSLAVITKVHVALANFNALRKEYEFAAEQAVTSNALARIMQSRYQAGEISLHQRLTAEFFALDARLKADLWGAEVVNATGQIYTNLGIDTVPDTIVSDDLAALSDVLKKRVAVLNDINKNLLPMAIEKMPASL